MIEQSCHAIAAKQATKALLLLDSSPNAIQKDSAPNAAECRDGWGTPIYFKYPGFLLPGKSI
jgi:hypothetical protein